ncbi:hypothetical protein niasHT_032977 [Heterodera trifolii]|uniref:Uncharacterized protein n=1 Tax=Heterodera trifolii TaxID=157864 RepID=A0ABD2HTX7_9BILA
MLFLCMFFNKLQQIGKAQLESDESATKKLSTSSTTPLDDSFFGVSSTDHCIEIDFDDTPFLKIESDDPANALFICENLEEKLLADGKKKRDEILSPESCLFPLTNVSRGRPEE